MSSTPSAPVRSFKRRGRMGPANVAALAGLGGRLGVPDGDGPLDPAALFGRTAPLVLDVGFGKGEATLAMAAADPGRDVVAVEVYRPGAASLVQALDAARLENVRVLVGDVVPLLEHRVAAASLDEVRVFFPDPWPKSRHHKRRLVSPAFVALVASRLRPGGTLHCATDWESYAEQMLAAVLGEPSLTVPGEGFAPRPPGRPLTRFESQGLAKGHGVRDVVAHRSAGG